MNTLPIESIETRIYVFRNQKVMLDMDLAYLYGVEVRTLNQTVKRNSQRFPDDFMFQLTTSEYELLKSQNVISKGKGGRRYMPYAFTQDGIAMLSSVLKSEKAIQVNIQIIRTFNRLRRIISENKDLRKKIAEIENRYSAKFSNVDKNIKVIFEALNKILTPPTKSKKFGFLASEKDNK